MFHDLVLAAGREFGRVAFCTNEKFLDGSTKVKLIRCPRFSNASLRTRLSSWLSFFATAGLKSFIEPGRPLLFIVSNPPFMPVFGWMAGKLRGQKYVLLFYDIYPEALIRFLGLPRRSLIARAWGSLNRLALKNAAATITISPGMADLLARYAPPGAARRISIIPTWEDVDFIRPVPKEQNEFARKHGQVGKWTVVYSGNIGNVHDVSMLTRVAERLRAESDIRFLIISDSPKRIDLERDAAGRGLSNMTFLPLQDGRTFPLALACGEVGIVALAAGGEGISMPSKVYSTMAAGSAVLGLSGPSSDLASLIRTCACGINVSPGDVQGAVDAILALKRNPNLWKAYRENARRAAVERFSSAVCVPQILSLLREILPSAGGGASRPV
jgi:glycosyltransferase involved in cell wall biosynthesis